MVSTRKQTRLTFTPLPSSSPGASADLPEQVANRVANVRYDTMASPTKKRRLAPLSSGNRNLDFQASSSTTNDPHNGTERSPRSVASGKQKLGPRANILSSNDSSIGMGLLTPEPSSQLQALGSSDESEAPTHHTRRKQRDCLKTQPSRPVKPVIISSDEDPDPVTPTRSSRRVRAAGQPDFGRNERSRDPLPRLGGQEKSESGDVDYSSDSLMNELKTSAKKAGRGKEEVTDIVEVSSDEAIVRRGRRAPRRKKSIQSDDPGHEAEVTRVRRSSTTKSGRQKQLDLLRKRRAGKDAALSSDDDLEIEEQIGAPHTDIGDLDEESDSQQLDTEDISKGANLDEYEEDFIEDDDDTIGAPLGLEDIPLEFTHHAHKKTIEYFKHVVEWMVHNKLNPAFARNDRIYVIARQKLEDAVQGFANSKFMSSAWKVEFLKALKEYPDIDRIDVPTMFEQKCEACGRSGHPAKHRLTFSGKPYHRESLEDISMDEDSSAEDSDEDQDTDVPQSKAFFLGRTCNANAETAHALHHWRHQLNQTVLDLLRTEGHTTPAKVLERESWSVKKRERYANRVVDGLEEDGRMRELYMGFKESLEAARSAK
ncbi:MAG: hypothetical protein Q9170_007238, partial [Blastenia crenularia]